MSGPPLWALRFLVPRAQTDPASDWFDGVGLSVAVFEHDGDGCVDAACWQIDVLFDLPPDLDALQAPFELWRASDCRVERLADLDWLQEAAAGVEPVHAGPFLIHAAKDRTRLGGGMIGVEIEAGLAFGSGEHPTTQACLISLANLDLRFRPQKILDMGCGSAVLSIATAKYWPDAKLFGVEIDPRAASVAQDNAAKNGVVDRIEIAAADGYDCSLVRYNAPFDLIFANILADTVCAMAADAILAIAPGGRLIISGLLERQIARVSAAHIDVGFAPCDQVIKDGWAALTLVTPPSESTQP